MMMIILMMLISLMMTAMLLPIRRPATGDILPSQSQQMIPRKSLQKKLMTNRSKQSLKMLHSLLKLLRLPMPRQMLRSMRTKAYLILPKMKML